MEELIGKNISTINATVEPDVATEVERYKKLYFSRDLARSQVHHSAQRRKRKREVFLRTNLEQKERDNLLNSKELQVGRRNSNK